MKKWLLPLTLLSSVSWAGNSMTEIAQRCQPLSPTEQTLYSSDFKWGYELPELLLKFTEMYQSPKRLAKRAFWDKKTKTLRLPYNKDRGGDIVITENFVQSVTRHIERAFELRYIDGVFFPDMGHSHLLIPEKLMKEKYDLYPVNQMSAMYRDVFKDKRIQLLYHTAEQLRMLDENDQPLADESVHWRWQTRNIIGHIDPGTDLTVLQNPESPANTVHEVPGHHWWSAGFNLSAQKNGCFEYRHNGQVYYFDLSMYDLEEPQR
jgi:hypothetical protein